MALAGGVTRSRGSSAGTAPAIGLGASMPGSGLGGSRVPGKPAGRVPGMPAAGALARVLARQQLLLVLDNCEHVINTNRSGRPKRSMPSPR